MLTVLSMLFSNYVVICVCVCRIVMCGIPAVLFFQAEDGIRDLVRSRGLGDVYKRQVLGRVLACGPDGQRVGVERRHVGRAQPRRGHGQNLSLIHI